MNLPFVVFTVEETIEDIAQRTHVMEIIQNDDNREFHTVIISTALLSQVGKILLQFLKEAKRMIYQRWASTTRKQLTILGIAHYALHLFFFFFHYCH